MGHRIYKRCPSCCKSHWAYLTLSLELENGSLDESLEISLNDPFELAEYYSLNGLEKLAMMAHKLQWVCCRCRISYSLAWRSLVGLDTKIELARWMCGEVVRGSPGLSQGSLVGSGVQGEEWG